MSKGGSMHQKHPPAKVATSRPASGGGRASCAAAGSPSPSGSSRRAPRRGARRDVFAPRAPFAPDPDDALAWVTVTEALDLPVQAPALLPLIPLVVSIGAIGSSLGRSDLVHGMSLPGREVQLFFWIVFFFYTNM